MANDRRADLDQPTPAVAPDTQPDEALWPEDWDDEDRYQAGLDVAKSWRIKGGQGFDDSLLYPWPA